MFSATVTCMEVTSAGMSGAPADKCSARRGGCGECDAGTFGAFVVDGPLCSLLCTRRTIEHKPAPGPAGVAPRHGPVAEVQRLRCALVPGLSLSGAAFRCELRDHHPLVRSMPVSERYENFSPIPGPAGPDPRAGGSRYLGRRVPIPGRRVPIPGPAVPLTQADECRSRWPARRRGRP
jgi:hypothetical protein